MVTPVVSTNTHGTRDDKKLTDGGVVSTNTHGTRDDKKLTDRGGWDMCFELKRERQQWYAWTRDNFCSKPESGEGK